MTMNNIDKQLKRCPWCGNEAYVVRNHMIKEYYPRCGVCSRYSDKNMRIITYKTPQEAVEAWNKMVDVEADK